MAEKENKKEKEDKKNNNENNISEPSKLKTDYNWECYKDTGDC